MLCLPALVYAVFVVIFAIIIYNHPLTQHSANSRISSAVSTLISGLVWSFIINYMCERGSISELLAWIFVAISIMIAIFGLTLLPRLVPQKRK